MPTFDFRCNKCQTVFEFTRPFGSEQKPACVKCKSKSVEKLFSPPSAIVFKGSGFYKTDGGKREVPKNNTANNTTPSSGDSAISAAPATSAASEKKMEPKKEAPKKSE